MKLKLIYSGEKPLITDRMKKYADWTFQKVDFNKLPKIEGGRYVDWDYLYDFVEDDGAMAVFDGNELDGVWGANSYYRGKHLMQVEWHKNTWRKWTQNKVTRLWKLASSKRKADYEQVVHTMEHELGHALCDYHKLNDTLHSFIALKRWEEWWDYMDFPTITEEYNRMEWLHEKNGDEIKPKCYILHTDLGTEKSTHDLIVHSNKTVSYNYYINKKGELIEYVPAGWTAWHAGVVHNPTPEAKKFFGSKNPNSMSIGICFEGMGEDANDKQYEAIKKIIDENPMPVFAHKELTDYKPQAPLNLKRKLEINPKEKPPLKVVIKLIQVLQKLGIVS